MLYIQQGATNKVIVTATEKVTISPPVYFLFEFYDMQRQLYYYCTGPDASTFLYRYNQFNITEKSNPDLLNNEVHLPQAGQYLYNIYQQDNNTNLDPANAVSIVETGILKVISDATVTPDVIYEPTNTTNLVYN